jgi:hypothetical protein
LVSEQKSKEGLVFEPSKEAEGVSEPFAEPGQPFSFWQPIRDQSSRKEKKNNNKQDAS